MAKKIAQVIPLARLKRDLHYFDYLIPAEMSRQIKSGQLVEIPFRSKKIKGVVLNLIKNSKFGIKKLKKIEKIIDPLPFLADWQLTLIKELSDYYFVSQAILTKMLVPEIPKRDRQGKLSFLNNIKFVAPPKSTFKLGSIRLKKQPLLLRYFYQENKIKAYLSLIEKALAKNKQIAIIVPQISDIEKIFQYLLEYKGVTSVFLNDLPKNKYFQEWLKIKKGQAKIIIGTRSAIFAPFNNLDLIIIDQEEDENHKQEEPTPRYNAKTVAFKLKKILNCHLVFCTNTPSFSSLFKIQNKKWVYLEIDKLKASPEIKIINRQDEFKKSNYSIFSEEMTDKIEYNLKRGQKVFLFLNRKGLATIATCKDCGYIAICPVCQLPLTLHASKHLVCHHCGHKENLFLFCPKCKGPEIKLTGTGTEKVEIEIKKIFSQSQTLKIDIETPFNGDSDKYDIIIGTQYAFKFINWGKINLIGVINADTLFPLADFKSFEKTFNLLYKLALYISNPKKEMIIQTFSPKNYIFQAFKKLDYKNFYLNELRERKTFKYPPFCQLIRLIYQNIEFAGGQEEINKIYKTLSSKIDAKNIIINPPVLSRTQQVRGRFRWQIVLKILDRKSNLDFLNNLPENIIIDKDPENLL